MEQASGRQLGHPRSHSPPARKPQTQPHSRADHTAGPPQYREPQPQHERARFLVHKPGVPVREAGQGILGGNPIA